MKKVLVVVLTTLLLTQLLLAQCPGNDSLWNRITFLNGASTISPDQKLKELLEWKRRIERCSSLPDTTVALLLQKIGIFFLRESNYIDAIKYTLQSIDITESSGSESQSQLKLLISKYYDLSKMYDSLRDVRKRLSALDSCASIASRINAIDQYYLFALYNKVQYLYDIGDYHSCIRYAEYCQKIGREYKRIHPEDTYDTGTWYVFSSLGWIVNSLLRIKDYSTAERLLRNKMEECKKAGLRNYFGILYGQLAEVLESKGEYSGALSIYNKALQFEKQWGSDYNCRVLFNNIGYLYNNHLLDPNLALKYYKKAFYYHNTRLPANRIDTLEILNVSSNIGNVYSKQNQFDSAFAYFKSGFDCIKSGASEEYLLSNSLDEFIQQKKMDYLVSLLSNKADAYLWQHKATGIKRFLESAIDGYKVSDKILGRIRNQQIDAKSKLLWRSNSRRLYEHAIDACFLSKNTKDAFYFFERSRAVLLNDQLNEQKWMGVENVLKIAQVKKGIQKLENKLKESNNSSDQFQAVKDEMFSANRELDQLEQLIKNNNPLYYQSFLDTTFITLKDIQHDLLNKDYTLIEIFSGDSSIYVLQATASNCTLNKVDKLDYESTTKKYISYISDPVLMNKDYSGFVIASNHLYKLIFQQPPLKGQRIIISPDGQYFPFESLVTSEPNQLVNWFLYDHAVSYTYSARFLMNDFSSVSSTAGKNFMGVAPINYPSSFALASLSGSDQSLNRISSYFGNPFKLSASTASRGNFLQQFSKYRVIQLYTHAAENSVNNEPVIYFADSALYLSELINESKPLTRLIILSACETGKGIDYQGEGVFSFNRGFAAMGIPSAITNLWSVDNESTYKLTELFYKYLTDGLPTDIALQKAKLEFIQTNSREKSLPYYWAAPVLVGKTDVIELSKPKSWKWIILYLSIGIAGFAFWALRKRYLQKKAIR